MIIILIIGYYFIIFLPKIKNEKILSDNQLTCSKMEDKVKDNYKTEYSSFASYVDSSNHYNQKLKKCIVSIAYSWDHVPNGSVDIEDVLDAVENKKIMHCKYVALGNREDNTCNNGNKITPEEFDDLKTKLMND